jgi:uncharacterized membrane protein YbaN (DUF454 family)
VNREEAKDILLLYRHGTADAADPQFAAALALSKSDPELKHWFVRHCALQFVLREKFRAITAPAGLKEQIISEQAALVKRLFWQRHARLVTTGAVAVVLVLLALWLRPGASDDTFAIYQNRMAGVALRGYAMDFATSEASQIRAWLAQNHAPADYSLPASLQNLAVTGCAIQSWQGAKVSMICFRTGRPLPPGAQSDLWLFVIDRASVKDAPASGPPVVAMVNQLLTATWTEGGKVYVLGVEGDEATLRKFL